MSSILRRRLPHFYISAHSPSLADRGLQDPPVFQRKCQGAGGEEWPGQGTGPHKSSAGSARGSEGGPGQSPAPTGCSAGSAGGIGGGMAGRGLLAPQLCRKMAGKIGHHLAWTQPGAKRGKRRKSLRPRTKTTSLAAANAAERPRKVRCQAHPAEDWQVLWALVQTSPRNLGEFGPCGQIRPQRLFSFGPCTARQGEPRSGERALWRVFSFRRNRKEGPPPEPSEAGPVGRGGRNGA